MTGFTTPQDWKDRAAEIRAIAKGLSECKIPAGEEYANAVVCGELEESARGFDKIAERLERKRSVGGIGP